MRRGNIPEQSRRRPWRHPGGSSQVWIGVWMMMMLHSSTETLSRSFAVSVHDGGRRISDTLGFPFTYNESCTIKYAADRCNIRTASKRWIISSSLVTHCVLQTAALIQQLLNILLFKHQQPSLIGLVSSNCILSPPPAVSVRHTLVSQLFEFFKGLLLSNNPDSCEINKIV